MKFLLTAIVISAVLAALSFAFPGVMFTLLGWPFGIILGNLLASVVWSSVFEWRLRIHHNRTRAGTDAVADALDTSTDGGLKEVMDAVKKIEAKLDMEHPGA